MPRAYNPKAADRGLFDALLDAKSKFGGKFVILEDQTRQPITYTELVQRAFVLGRRFAQSTAKGERVGVMLPSSTPAAITFFGLHAFGRTPVMINFTAGVRNVKLAAKSAGVKTIITSRRFISEAAPVRDLIEGLESDCRFVYLEDIRNHIGLADKLFGLAASAAPRLFRVETKPSDPGVILFTSGSYGAPKGVVLTQSNLLANVDQVLAHIDFQPDWVLFNPLPVFHSFGLLAGLLLSTAGGYRTFNYPSPLHIKQIPPLIKSTGASILLATDTFLSQYARAAADGEMSGLAFICCGAERVRDETHDLVARKIGPVPVVEGYGSTETSPVLAINTPLDNRRGTAGGVVPGIEIRLETVEGIKHGKRLFVRGPNIMAGYLNEAGGIDAPPEGWHDMGDIVDVSDDNWITILGRVKRFAKIGGEMVSLTAAEALAAQVWPDARHAVISLPDPKKGERLILITDRLDATAEKLLEQAQANGVSELTVPKRIVTSPQIPVLGTGKTDYVAVQKIAEAVLVRAA